MKNYLEFERDVKDLEEELEKLKDPFNKEGQGLSEVETDKIGQIQSQIDEKLKILYKNLNAWQITQVARYENRPKSKFFIDNLFTNFINLSGDRSFSEDESILAGFAQFEERSVLVIGQEKGEDLDSRIKRNFGMTSASGYKKSIKLMKLADKFNIPCIAFIDTPGALPTQSSERQGIAQAIASCIECQMSLRVPVIAVIIGEGGSGGAISLASANKVLMLENAIYSVISPEGCASILWKEPNKAPISAEALKLTANELLKMQIVDEVIKEPIGGAHRDKEQIISSTREVLKRYLQELKKHSREEIFVQRKEKFLNIGKQKSFRVFSTDIDWINKSNFFGSAREIFVKFKKELIIGIILLAALLLYFL